MKTRRINALCAALAVVLAASACSLLNRSTPTATFKAFYEASNKKDVAGMKKTLSKGTLDMFDKLAKEIEQVMRTQPIDAVQLTYNALDREAEERLLPLAQEKGIAIVVNRPFREGKLLTRLASKPLPRFASEIGAKNWPQLLLKFVVSNPAVTCAIPATRSVAHLEDDLAAGRGAMPDAAMRARIAIAVSDA